MPTYPPKDQSAHNSNKIMVTKVQLNSFDASDSGVKRTQESSEMGLNKSNVKSESKEILLGLIDKIISIYMNNDGYVDMRKIHKYIKIRRDYSGWIKHKIDMFNFLKTKDYKIIEYDYLGNVIDGVKNNNRVSKRDYLLTYDSCYIVLMQDIIHVIKCMVNEAKTYLVKSRETGFTKIGRTANIKNRVERLKLDYGDVYLYAITNKDIERRLHKIYELYRVEGEWFNLNNKMIDEIVNIFEFDIVEEK